MELTTTEVRLVHDLARSFIASKFPKESVYFAYVWDQFVGNILELSPTGSFKEQLHSGALPFASVQGANLVTPEVVTTLWFLMAEMRDQGWEPCQDQIGEAIKAASSAFGASTRLANSLADQIAPQLVQWINDGMRYPVTEITQQAGDKESDPTQGTFVAVRLSEGELSDPEVVDVKRARELFESNDSDIVVDECANLKVRIKRETEPVQQIITIPKNSKVMLWLVMDNAGGIVSHTRIRKLHGFSMDPVREKKLGYFRSEFAKWLGKRADKVIPKIKQGKHARGWQVPRSDWSFCWIRSSNKNVSLLVKHIKQSRLEESD